MQPVVLPAEGTPIFVSGLALLIIPFLITMLVLVRVNRLSAPNAAGVATLLVLLSAVLMRGQLDLFSHYMTPEPRWRGILRLLVAPMVPTLGCFLFMLIQKWLGTTITPREQLGGAAGWAAWFSLGRIGWILLITLALSLWRIVPIMPITFLVLLVCLGAYPLYQYLSEPEASAPVTDSADIAPEREKVLSMVADKQITPEEGAELLSALAAHRVPQQPIPAPMSRRRKLVVASALLVIVGFFMPWFVVNPGRELGRLAQHLPLRISNSGLLHNNGVSVPGLEAGLENAVQTPDVQINGPDIGSGLGWIILLLASAAASIPLAGSRLDSGSQRVFALCALGLGTFLLLYLLTSNFRHASLGILMVAIGYAGEIFGILLPARHSTKAPQPLSPVTVSPIL